MQCAPGAVWPGRDVLEPQPGPEMVACGLPLGGKGGADVGGGAPGPERDRGRHGAGVRAAIGTSSSGTQGPGQREQCIGRRTR